MSKLYECPARSAPLSSRAIAGVFRIGLAALLVGAEPRKRPASISSRRPVRDGHDPQRLFQGEGCALIGERDDPDQPPSPLHDDEPRQEFFVVPAPAAR